MGLCRRATSPSLPWRWIIISVRGALLLVGIRNAKMAEDAVEALGWRLNVDEVKQLDAYSAEGGSGLDEAVIA